jgi:glutamine synthetase
MTTLQDPASTSSASSFSDDERKVYSQALLRTLTYANVKFVRYLAIDLYNTPRCKALPVKYLLTTSSIDAQVAYAKCVFGGLPSFADIMVEGSGLDTKDTVVFQPDISTLRILPYSSASAMVLGTLRDQTTGLLSDLCTRGLLQEVVRYATEDHKIAFNVGAELEFVLVDAHTDQPVDRAVYACTVTLNKREDFMVEVSDQLSMQGIDIEMIHSESAPGQVEIVLAYQESPVQLADHVVLTRETITAVAYKHGMKILFLPKTDPTEAGNGCHVHMSLRDIETGRNIFSSTEALGRRRQSFLQGSSKDISPQGQSFMEGILRRLPALLALTLPTANSFRRVGKGCWTGHQVGWAFGDKEMPLRVVANLHSQAWEHFEYKLCDNTANMYLALAGILSAGLTGLDQDLELRASHEEEMRQEHPESLPTSLTESLDCLENDELLMKIMPSAMSKAYLACRRLEAERSAETTLEDEVKDALERA